jgi:hypothetical protein
MTEPQKSRKRRYPPPVRTHQINIAFESTELRGLTSAQRMKVVMQMAQVLILAAGIAPKESDDER